MKYSLGEMFWLINNDKSSENLFDFDLEVESRKYELEEIVLVSAICSGCFDPCVLCEDAQKFFHISEEGFYSFVYAWLSEEAIVRQMLSFARMVIADPKAALDRGNEDTCTVLAAEAKVMREIDRMHGILRFSPDDKGVYTARCEPDHFVLPALADYFTARFGDSVSWAIIDEKRRLVLSRSPGGSAQIHGLDSGESLKNGEKDPWEELWKHYHKTINNESRDNPRLQRQFLPKRYWNHLPEIKK